MALWNRRRESTPPPLDPEVERRRQQWALLERRMEQDPVFSMQTFDGLAWIDPFTGRLVSAPFGFKDVAREFFSKNEHWRRMRPKPLVHLQAVRWLHWIKEHLHEDRRLRIFSDSGEWLNPATGQWVAEVRAPDGQVTAGTLQDMARYLVASRVSSPNAFLDLKLLQQIARESGQGSGEREISGLARIVAEDWSAPNVDPEEIRRRRQRAITVDESEVEEERDEEDEEDEEGADELDESTTDLDRARSVQQRMLPQVPYIPGYRIEVYYKPYHYIGGDLYDLIPLDDDHLLVLMGDVTGHGVQAALVVSSFIKSLRFIARQEHDLVEILAQLNDSMREDLVTGQFITCFAGILEVSTRTIECCCAGHHPALVVNPRSPTVLRKIGQLGIGIGLANGGMLRRSLRVERYQLEEGDVLFQYTDGLSEAQHEERGEYGDLRCMGVLVAFMDRHPAEILDAVASDVNGFADGKVDDDITMLALQVRDPEAEAAGEEGDGAEDD